MESETPGQRFLDAFNEIEHVLRSRSKTSESHLGFSELVRSSKDLVERQKNLLRDYAELRNAIVHTRTLGGQIIADPREDVVLKIVEQAELIENPPRVLSALRLSPPRMFASSDSILDFLEIVRPPTYFSQAPVRTADGAISLVTTNAVARWVSDGWEPLQGAILPETDIASVLEFAESGDRVLIRDRGLRVVEAWRLFTGEAGDPPAAILLTHTGIETETPLGLCVRADLPEMLRSLKV